MGSMTVAVVSTGQIQAGSNLHSGASHQSVLLCSRPLTCIELESHAELSSCCIATPRSRALSFASAGSRPRWLLVEPSWVHRLHVVTDGCCWCTMVHKVSHPHLGCTVAKWTPSHGVMLGSGNSVEIAVHLLLLTEA